MNGQIQIIVFDLRTMTGEKTYLYHPVHLKKISYWCYHISNCGNARGLCKKMLVQHQLPCKETAQYKRFSHIRSATRKIKDRHYANLDLDDAARQTFPGMDFNQN